MCQASTCDLLVAFMQNHSIVQIRLCQMHQIPISLVNWNILLGKLPGVLNSALVPATRLVQGFRPVSSNTDVSAEVVFLRGRCQGERMPLQMRDGRTLQEDILTHFHLKALLLQLQLQGLWWMHHYLACKKHWAIWDILRASRNKVLYWLRNQKASLKNKFKFQTKIVLKFLS